MDIGRWMLDEGYAHWLNYTPPKFEVQFVEDRVFRVKGTTTHRARK